jgi:hypothetical protein
MCLGSTKALVRIPTKASLSMSRYCADLFEKFEEIWLPSLFDYLPISESIDVKCLKGDFFPVGGTPKNVP